MKNLIFLTNLNREDIYSIVRNNLFSCKTIKCNINNSNLHHNTSYKLIPSIIKNGIVSLGEKRNLEGNPLTSEELITFNESGHVNGTSSVSLTDDRITEDNLYRNEELYGHEVLPAVDICIQNEIKKFLFVHRDSTNYGDEYLADGSISPNYFSSFDLRILKYIEKIYATDDLIDTINSYNHIIEIANQMLISKINIPIREMSYEELTLDKEKLIKLPKLVLKR